jgi:hypothetical protein
MTESVFCIPRDNIIFSLEEASKDLAELLNVPSPDSPLANVGVLLVLWKEDDNHRLQVEVLPQGLFNRSHVLSGYETGFTLLDDWCSQYKTSGGLPMHLISGSLAFVNEEDLEEWLVKYKESLTSDLLNRTFFVLHKTDDGFERVMIKIVS